MVENAQNVPNRDELIKFFKEQIEVKELQLKLQEINTRYAAARAEELKALSFIGQITQPKSTDVAPEEDTVPHIVTQDDLDLNPELVQYGVKVGDEVMIPKSQVAQSVNDILPSEEGSPATDNVSSAKSKTLKKK